MTAGRLALTAAVVAGLAALAYALVPTDGGGDAATDSRPIAVETRPVDHGTLVDRRSFPGSVEAAAEFTVAPKIAGRVAEVTVELGDEVERGQVVVRLDDDEYAQALTQAEAELQVAQARVREATSARGRADRRLERVQRLERQGIASASELDDAQADAATQAAAVAVARAQVAQAQAALETAQVRLGYTRVTADWPGDDQTRLVGERLVDAGDTVAANAELLTIVATRRLKAVIRVPQSVYGSLAPGRRAEVSAPSMPEASFPAQVARIAPRLDPASRQARVELTVDNPERTLVPGMFVQVAIETERIDNAAIVPTTALVDRGGRSGIFVVDAEAGAARFVPAQIALRSGDRVALKGAEPIPGEVVVLGQDQLTDGAAVVRPEADEDDSDAATAG